MSSRENILREVAQNKPAGVHLPIFFAIEEEQSGLTERFLDVLHSIGGKGERVSNLEEVLPYLRQRIQEGVEVVNALLELEPFNVGRYKEYTAEQLQHVHTVFLKGGLAVAENAAIWVSEAAMLNRLLPFLCQELVLVIAEADLVANMHDAYKKMPISNDGYGVFIAGPSKTADIEQSLVIGAHGALSMQVFIIK